MAKSIVTIGFEIPGHKDKHVALDSDRSLLDFDIIVFTPVITGQVGYHNEQYLGKPCLDDDRSFKLKERAAKWKAQIHSAFDSGKTIFIYLPELCEVYVSTGTKSYSGTGRNRATTRHVEPFNNYSLLPLQFDEIVKSHGREIRGTQDLGVLSAYWSEFGPMSHYEVHLSSKTVKSMPVTKSGNKTVGGIASGKSQSGKGRVVMLPQLSFDGDEFFDERAGQLHWSKKALQVGHRLISTFTEIDKVLTSASQRTPAPSWVVGDEFRLAGEDRIEQAIAQITVQVEKLDTEKRTLLGELETEGTLRSLLFETGVALEDGILQALSILGLQAERFKEGESEFDAVFTWRSRRFLGEAEGKDNKALNVDKISQLERNLSEDFSRDEVSAYAKGILFGNAYRLKPLSEREGYFTDKCISTAARLKAALVRTPDLFFIAKYLKEFPDKDFADKCIEAILNAEGTVVVFPVLPAQSPVVTASG